MLLMRLIGHSCRSASTTRIFLGPLVISSNGDQTASQAAQTEAYPCQQIQEIEIKMRQQLEASLDLSEGK
jgi:hypothetical protein